METNIILEGDYLLKLKDLPTESVDAIVTDPRRWQNTGEIIKAPYFLHHKNLDKHDDRFENLEKTNRSEHAKKHTPQYFGRNKPKDL